MRALLIWGGLALIEHFSWMFILFGLFLVATGARLAIKEEKEIALEENILYKWLQRCIPFTPKYHLAKLFLLKRRGKWIATPLLILLIMIELTDLIFALDSIPAILGITTEPFIVFTSNIFAILGLRALFFVLKRHYGELLSAPLCPRIHFSLHRVQNGADQLDPHPYLVYPSATGSLF